MKPAPPICQAISHRDPLKPVARDKSIRGERDLPYLFYFLAKKEKLREPERIVLPQRSATDPCGITLPIISCNEKLQKLVEGL